MLTKDTLQSDILYAQQQPIYHGLENNGKQEGHLKSSCKRKDITDVLASWTFNS